MRVWRWMADHPWVTSLVMVAVLTAAAGYRDLNRDADQDRFIECVSRWADQTSARSGQLGPARDAVDGANDTLWRTMAQLLNEPRSDAREVFRARLDEYKDASDQHRALARDHPAPPPPTLDCK